MSKKQIIGSRHQNFSMERQSRRRNIKERIDRGGEKNPNLMGVVNIAGGVDAALGLFRTTSGDVKIGGVLMMVGIAVFVGSMADAYFKGKN